MTEYEKHFLQEVNMLTSYLGTDLSSPVMLSIERTLDAYDLDRLSLYPFPNINIEIEELISIQRGDVGGHVLEKDISTSLQDYISMTNDGNTYHIFSRDEMKSSPINTLRLLEFDGVKWHIVIPIRTFGQLNAGLSVSRFEDKRFSLALINSLKLIGSLWFMNLYGSISNKLCEIESESRILASEKLRFLTKRQLEVLRMIGSGMSTKNISIALNLSVRTIESHRYRISDKLNLNKYDTLSNFAKRNNLLLQSTLET
ncbi:response regulator transcription factor [Vibrio comitans]|uniref:HTH luxR-type domain-containing protein n=1 Tax=Vibrio comitans NBRC 102076 TaxID=1219078 RepID=A0A4Y3IT53_9VIBR|nr:helix-turn-helix transcriptional regulator [Vibrio comitans]GEA61910.1 hypothetical protein VCO01S_31030 [Vibrio comitans NBRC 102076]